MTATHDAHRLAPPQFARLPRAQVPLYIQKNEKPRFSRCYFGCLKACKSAKKTSQTSQAMVNCSERPFYNAHISQNPSTKKNNKQWSGQSLCGLGSCAGPVVHIIAQPMLNASTNKPALLQDVDIMETGSLKSLQDEFHLFVNNLAQNDSTCKLWKGFLFTDFLAFFTALCTQNWSCQFETDGPVILCI